MPDIDYLPPTLPFEADQTSLDGLSAYLDQLVAWNRVINLSAFESREKIMSELIVDSFYLADFLGRLFPGDAMPLTADLGAGAGLPGIPLRLLWKAGSYTMVEAREKRALFLTNVLSRLKLERVNVFRGTVEKFFAIQDAIKKPDCIISRAFMPWPKLGSLCGPHLEQTGLLVVMSSQKAPSHLGSWQLFQDYSYPVAGKNRYLWALRKKAD